MPRPLQGGKGSSPEAVLDALRRRSDAGRRLSSGDNRGDWLYAAACRFFGSWKAAVESAGFYYLDMRRINLTAEDVLYDICRIAAKSESLRSSRHTSLAEGARRHFGSWKAAVEAGGCTLPSPY